MMTPHMPEDSARTPVFGPGHEVARLIQGGLPVIAGLRACAEESCSRRDRANLRRMADRLEAGAPVEEVISQTSGIPDYLKQITAAGVRTGQLAPLLADYLTLSRQRRDLQQQLLMAGVYPLLVLLALIAVGSIFPVWIIPQFANIFNDFGLELPAITQFVIALSNWALRSWPLLLGLLLAGAVAFLGHGTLPGRGIRQAILKMIPVLGASLRHAGLSEFCFLLSVLIRAGIDLPEALTLLGTSLNDMSLRRESRRLSSRIAAGESIGELIRTSHLPPELLDLFNQTASTDALAEQLRMYGVLHATQAEVKLRQTLVLLEPTFIVIIAVGAGGLILSILAPLIRLLNDLS